VRGREGGRGSESLRGREREIEDNGAGEIEEWRRGNALSLSLYLADCTVNSVQCLCVRTVTQYIVLPFSYIIPTV
jgi:hypothetical protein